jgi:hypothetical protein
MIIYTLLLPAIRNKFLQLDFAGVLDIFQRILLKKFHNGHVVISLPGVSLKHSRLTKEKVCMTATRRTVITNILSSRQAELSSINREVHSHSI